MHKSKLLLKTNKICFIHSLSEKAHLLRNMFGAQTRGGTKTESQDSVESHELPSSSRDERMHSRSMIRDADVNLHGFAFSQEEKGVVSQSQLIRHYDSSAPKPQGK